MQLLNSCKDLPKEGARQTCNVPEQLIWLHSPLTLFRPIVLKPFGVFSERSIKDDDYKIWENCSWWENEIYTQSYQHVPTATYRQPFSCHWKYRSSKECLRFLTHRVHRLTENFYALFYIAYSDLLEFTARKCRSRSINRIKKALDK